MCARQHATVRKERLETVGPCVHILVGGQTVVEVEPAKTTARAAIFGRAVKEVQNPIVQVVPFGALFVWVF
jgi:hypothetical protein